MESCIRLKLLFFVFFFLNEKNIQGKLVGPHPYSTEYVQCLENNKKFEYFFFNFRLKLYFVIRITFTSNKLHHFLVWFYLSILVSIFVYGFDAHFEKPITRNCIQKGISNLLRNIAFFVNFFVFFCF